MSMIKWLPKTFVMTCNRCVISVITTRTYNVYVTHRTYAYVITRTDAAYVTTRTNAINSQHVDMRTAADDICVPTSG